MVLDCPLDAHQEVEALCQRYRSSYGCSYGIHRSENALMTCCFSGFDDAQHIHFIDGGKGGYAMAAKQLKRQLKENDAAGAELT